MGSFFRFLIRLGLLGPLLLGIADSSFLFLPFGNDLLLVIVLARDIACLRCMCPWPLSGRPSEFSFSTLSAGKEAKKERKR